MFPVKFCGVSSCEVRCYADAPFGDRFAARSNVTSSLPFSSGACAYVQSWGVETCNIRHRTPLVAGGLVDGQNNPMGAFRDKAATNKQTKKNTLPVLSFTFAPLFFSPPLSAAQKRSSCLYIHIYICISVSHAFAIFLTPSYCSFSSIVHFLYVCMPTDYQHPASPIMEPSSLPVIDVSQLFCDRQAILKVAAQIDEACRTWGFFYIIGHGIPAERFQKLTEMAKAFFSLPLEEKLKIDIQKSKHHRGYGGVGTEYLDPANPTDYKETFDMGCNLPEDHPAVVAGKPLRGPNRHPTGVEGWAELMENHYRGMHELSLILLRALAMAIGIEDDFFDSRFFEPLSVFRMIYYPVLSAKEGERVVCGEHTDYGVMTLLYQDDATGLQVRNLSGEWMDVPPLQGSLVVNIGDMMAMWSNGRYKSTPHRVINPGVERISMPFFCEPNPDALITCLDHCKSPENPAKFPTVRASDWLQKRFAQTYEYRRVL